MRRRRWRSTNSSLYVFKIKIKIKIMQAPLAQYKQLLLDFEKAASGSSSSPPRKSLGKDAKALWPPGTLFPPFFGSRL